MAVDQSVLDEIVRRSVDVAHLNRIILFGSAARDQMGPGSDVDLLVVTSGVPRRSETTCEPSSARLSRKGRNSLPPDRKVPAVVRTPATAVLVPSGMT